MVDFTVLEKNIYAVEDLVGDEGIKSVADSEKTKSFGLVSNLFMRPKKEDITVNYIEKRYEPFWHIVCSTHVEYDREKEYLVEVGDDVVEVTLAGKKYDARKNLMLDAMEHCIKDLRKEEFIDAVTGERVNNQSYLWLEKKKIAQTEELLVGDTIVVPAKVKASSITRNLLRDMMKPVKAHDILREEVKVETLNLYFRPVYAVEYLWAAKNKTAVIEVDGATKKTRPGGKTIKQKMREIFNEDDLFDVGAEVANTLIPGGGIALKIAKSAMKRK